MSDAHCEPDDLAEATRLIDCLLDENLSPEGARQLEQMLRERADVRRHYILQLHLWCGAMPYAMAAGKGISDPSEVRATPAELSNAMILPAITGDANSKIPMTVAEIQPAENAGALDELAHLLPPPSGVSAPTAPPQVKVPPRMRLKSLPRWRAAAAVLLAIGGLLAIFAVLHHPSAATLVASVDAKWEQADHAKGDAFAVGTTSKLISGFAELHFKGGATVIAEGPAEIMMRSDREIFVASGKILANVPGGGFVVSTPSATITDLGTEFGVNVSGQDRCEVAVLKGKVQVESKSQLQNEASGTAARVLVEGEAVTISSTSVLPLPSSGLAQSFTRTLQAGTDSLDVVDLVAGGDGTTHRRGSGIDTDGNWGNLAPIFGVLSDGIYHPVHGLSAVDGVFLPKGTPAATQLDSAGNSFVFPTLLGMSNDQIWAGGPIPAVTGSEPIPSTLDGIDYSAPGHGLLFLHGSRGLTFDLDAIRRLHPATRIAGFRCVIGNMYSGPGIVKADAWVFTDGHIQLSVHNTSNHDKPTPVSIGIKDTDHYLTIVTGFASIPDYAHSWLAAGDPVLELETR